VVAPPTRLPLPPPIWMPKPWFGIAIVPVLSVPM
jgi:hypothetical protein